MEIICLSLVQEKPLHPEKRLETNISTRYILEKVLQGQRMSANLFIIKTV